MDMNPHAYRAALFEQAPAGLTHEESKVHHEAQARERRLAQMQRNRDKAAARAKRKAAVPICLNV